MLHCRFRLLVHNFSCVTMHVAKKYGISLYFRYHASLKAAYVASGSNGYIVSYQSDRSGSVSSGRGQLGRRSEFGLGPGFVHLHSLPHFPLPRASRETRKCSVIHKAHGIVVKLGTKSLAIAWLRRTQFALGMRLSMRWREEAHIRTLFCTHCVPAFNQCTHKKPSNKRRHE